MSLLLAGRGGVEVLASSEFEVRNITASGHHQSLTMVNIQLCYSGQKAKSSNSG